MSEVEVGALAKARKETMEDVKEFTTQDGSAVLPKYGRVRGQRHMHARAIFLHLRYPNAVTLKHFPESDVLKTTHNNYLISLPKDHTNIVGAAALVAMELSSKGLMMVKQPHSIYAPIKKPARAHGTAPQGLLMTRLISFFVLQAISPRQDRACVPRSWTVQGRACPLHPSIAQRMSLI